MTDDSATSSPKVGLVYSKDYVQSCCQWPRMPGRALYVQSLIDAYGLREDVVTLAPKRASAEQLCKFHSKAYVACLKAENDGCEEGTDEADLEAFGLSHDCQPFEGLFDYACSVAGGSLTAADALAKGACGVAINWEGGWHHAHRDEAAGFCYVNDIVLAALHLQESGLRRVLYVDLDLHHGDGVEEAFSRSTDVMTVSFHKNSPGFFPGSGRVEDCGQGKGRFFALNIPLLDGACDETFCNLFSSVMSEVRDRFAPSVVICQCGCDALIGDPMDCFNLTPDALCRCVRFLQSWQVPLLLLGGGGYNGANTARCWTLLTAKVTGKQLDNNIPEHKFFHLYGPDFTLRIPPGNRRDCNTKEHTEASLRTIRGYLANINPPINTADKYKI